MKYFSMFSGVGGFELGIQRAFDNRSVLQNASHENNEDLPQSEKSADGPICIGFSEIDKHAIKTYEAHFGGHKNYGDATKINADELPQFDLLCGGFPCQAFSIAGKRRGFQDTRGTLFFDIARIVETKRPKYLLLENVKGLLNHNKGETFGIIIQTLDELGYDVQWLVLNGKFFGVPQNRERVFFVGSLRGIPRPEILPFPSNNGETAYDIKRLGNMPGFRRYNQVYDTSGICEALDTAKGGGHQHCIKAEPIIHPTITCALGRQGSSSEFKASINAVANCIDSHYYKGNSASSTRHTLRTFVPVLTPDRLEKRQNGRRFKENGEEMFTLNTQDKHGILNEEMKIRRLTPLECERLMSWPDNWTIGSDTQRYKQCGNGVISNCVQAIMERILETANSNEV